MKSEKSLLAVRVGAETARSYVVSANPTQHAERSTRISSLKPHFIVLLAAIVAATSFGLAAKQLLATDQVPWLLLALGIAHATVALAGFVKWKCVWSGAGHYVVSNFIQSDQIVHDDVCMIVQGHGQIWKRVHVHFRRPTRFGWSITYVAINPSMNSKE